MTATLAETLRSARATLGLTLREVERRTGVSNSAVSQIERGHVTDPSTGTLAMLAAVYGLDMRTLFELAGHPLPGGDR